MRYDWGDLTSTDLAALAARKPVAALVLGAIEQHGPHLPLATDLIIGEGLLSLAGERLEEDFPLLVLPSLSLGASAEHAGFAGTLVLSPEQMKHQVVAIGDGLARSGFERLVLVNAHGGNIGWMNDAALELRRRLGLLAVKASYMQFEPPAELLSAAELRDGLHGGLAETAMMLHIAPELVRMERARDFRPNYPHGSPLAPQGEAAWAWLAEDLHAAGVVGDAASADAALGERLLSHYANRLARIIEASRDLVWPPPA
ncbi:creatininase family protein [Wenzhouxiangella sp. XN24]|uniref:creatininase family protein n=1 Tax=Wenzhouxiangella sp. XN24 TaxID=2713569 RepID=UPI0013ED4C07|nr:creatininase family protein [Wenzhouxiangella sp. XN24]NGX17111.1 creatininase family protein [Wenzhouxiangella sp. XN24]